MKGKYKRYQEKSNHAAAKQFNKLSFLGTLKSSKPHSKVKGIAAPFFLAK